MLRAALTEKACRALLFRLRWPEGFICPNCKRTKSWPMGNGRVACGFCGRQVSVTAGTALQDCRLPLRKIIRAAIVFTTPGFGISARGLQTAAGLSRYETALNLADRFRHAMAWPDLMQLSGRVALRVISLPAAGRREVPALLMLSDRDCGGGRRLRAVALRELSGNCIAFHVITCVAKRTRITAAPSDEFAWLSERRYRYRFSADRNGADPLLARCCRAGDNLCAWLKRVHRGTVQSRSLQGYLDEFAFRRDYKMSHEKTCRALLCGLVGGPPPASDSPYIV